MQQGCCLDDAGAGILTLKAFRTLLLVAFVSGLAACQTELSLPTKSEISEIIRGVSGENEEILLDIWTVYHGPFCLYGNLVLTDENIYFISLDTVTMIGSYPKLIAYEEGRQVCGSFLSVSRYGVLLTFSVGDRHGEESHFFGSAEDVFAVIQNRLAVVDEVRRDLAAQLGSEPIQEELDEGFHTAVEVERLLR